ncbi:MAG: Sua5/YciO/YrdC/YwlC family protein [Chromatiales bacterium]|nr:Sua5/YciO/YrdC/YwlC family protein [Chromatiales bacterium]
MANPDFLAPRLRHAAAVLHAGGVIAYPTEGVFGLGCRPDDARAVQRLLELKQRPVSAGLILIAARFEQLADWIEPTGREIRQLTATRSGPVTWLVTAGPLTPEWITGGRPTVAIRVTRHPVAAGLCLASGLPLVSTSANRRGKPPARSALGARLRFGRWLDLVVGGATGGAAGPTEIRDAASGQVIRAG